MNDEDGGGQFLDFMGDTAVMRGDIELMGVPPSPPPIRENPDMSSYGFSLSNLLLFGQQKSYQILKSVYYWNGTFLFQ